ncbi:MAG: tripartite tricarboxylate transporter TctB family protein [Lachnospiraceae bacterium]
MENKTTRIFELLAAILLGMYSGVMIFYGMTHSVEAANGGMKSYTFPLIMYGIMLVCCVILIIQNRAAAAKSDKGEKPERLDKRVWMTIAAILIYVALWKVIGFMLSTFLFVTGESKALKKDEPILRCAAVALGAVAVIYIVFVRVFSISLPETFLSGLI